MKTFLLSLALDFSSNLILNLYKKLAKRAGEKEDESLYEKFKDATLEAAETSVKNTYTEFTKEDLEFLKGKMEIKK